MADDDISVGSVSVDVVPDMRLFRKGVEAQTKDLVATVRVGIDDAQFDAELQRATRGRSTTVRVKADGQQADADIDEVSRDRTAKVRVKVDDTSLKQSDAKVHILLDSLALLAPTVAPFSAAALGGVAALGALGGAAVLAVKGISTEMKDGTAEGLVYKQMLGGLSGELGVLEHTAATNVLGGFGNAVNDVSADMPRLNGEVSFLTKSLGSDLGPLASGLLGTFTDLSPVINDIAGGVHGLAVDFDGWANGPGGTKFVDYLEQALPEVWTTIVALGGAVGHLIQGLEPLGGPILGAITGVSDVLRALPVPVVTALFAAFLGYRSIILTQKAIEGVTGALKSLAVAEAVAAGAGGGGGVSGAARAALGSGEGVIGARFAVGAEGATQDASLLGTRFLAPGAAAAGIGLGATAGVLGGGVGLAALIATQIHSNDVNDNRGAVNGLLAPGALQSAQAQLAFLQQQRNNLPAATSGPQLRGPQGQSAALGKQITVLGSQIDQAKAIQAQKDAAAAVTSFTAAVAKGRPAILQYTAAVAAQGAAFVGTQQAELGLHGAIADANAALKANGATLDENTAKGRANMSALIGVEQAEQGKIAADVANGASTHKLNADLDTAYGRLVKEAEGFGDSASKANALAAAVLHLPDVKTTKIVLSGITGAQSQLDAFAGKLSNLDKPHVVKLRVEAQFSKLLENLLETGRAGVAPHTGGYINQGVLHRAHGGAAFDGYVTGPGTTTSDSVSAMLSNKEFVLDADATASLGVSWLTQVNRAGRNARAYLPDAGRHVPPAATGTTGGMGHGGLPPVVFDHTVVKDVDELLARAYSKQQDLANAYALGGTV